MHLPLPQHHFYDVYFLVHFLFDDLLAVICHDRVKFLADIYIVFYKFGFQQCLESIHLEIAYAEV